MYTHYGRVGVIPTLRVYQLSDTYCAWQSRIWRVILQVMEISRRQVKIQDMTYHIQLGCAIRHLLHTSHTFVAQQLSK